MATLYVAKDGSDSNNGTTWALAKLTIQGAANIATTGDTIKVGPGVYKEAVALSITGNFTLTIEGDGYVIIDCDNTYATGLAITSTGTGTITYKNLIVRGATGTGIGLGGASGTFSNVCENCVVYNCGNGFAQGSDGVNNRYITLTNCLAYDNTNGFYMYNIDHAIITWCTFADNSGRGVYSYDSWAANSLFKHNIVAFNGRGIDVWSWSTSQSDYNDIYWDGSQTCYNAGVQKTTLADWRTATSEDANSVSEDPKFFDRSKDTYSLSSSSTLRTNINEGGTLGAGIGNGLTCVGMSKNDYEGNWANRILSGTQVNASDNIEVTTTSGYARTPVINLGAIKKIRWINIKTNLVNAMYPANVPDYSTSDVQPKRMTFRYRYSTSSFVDGDVTPSWAEIEPSALGQDVSVLAQYFQVEVTLRENGT